MGSCKDDNKMNIRWGIFWRGDCLTSDFYESWNEPCGTVWSMAIAYDLITRLNHMILVDTEEDEAIMKI